MKKLTFEQLVKGKLYGDKDGINIYIFRGFRNDYLATFYVCEYDEEQCCYLATTEERYYNAREIERWREW